MAVLSALGERNDEGVDDGCRGKSFHYPAGNGTAVLNCRVDQGQAKPGQHDEERVTRPHILVLHVPTCIVIAVGCLNRLKEGGQKKPYDKKVEPDPLLSWKSPEQE